MGALVLLDRWEVLTMPPSSLLRSTQGGLITNPLAQWLAPWHSVDILCLLGFELESPSEPEVFLESLLNFSEVIHVTELHKGIGRVETEVTGKCPTALLARDTESLHP